MTIALDFRSHNALKIMALCGKVITSLCQLAGPELLASTSLRTLESGRLGLGTDSSLYHIVIHTLFTVLILFSFDDWQKCILCYCTLNTLDNLFTFK